LNILATLLKKKVTSGGGHLPCGYCTHEGSGMGRSERDIQKLCPGAKVLSGLAIKGGAVGKAVNDLAYWLKKLGLIS